MRRGEETVVVGLELESWDEAEWALLSGGFRHTARESAGYLRS
jgi:hypothetical protein